MTPECPANSPTAGGRLVLPEYVEVRPAPAVRPITASADAELVQVSSAGLGADELLILKRPARCRCGDLPGRADSAGAAGVGQEDRMRAVGVAGVCWFRAIARAVVLALGYDAEGAHQPRP